jgi:hypothetical protein
VVQFGSKGSHHLRRGTAENNFTGRKVSLHHGQMMSLGEGPDFHNIPWQRAVMRLVLFTADAWTQKSGSVVIGNAGFTGIAQINADLNQFMGIDGFDVPGVCW